MSLWHERGRRAGKVQTLIRVAPSRDEAKVRAGDFTAGAVPMAACAAASMMGTLPVGGRFSVVPCSITPDLAWALLVYSRTDVRRARARVARGSSCT